MALYAAKADGTGGKVHVCAVPSGQLGSRVSFEVGESAQMESNASVRFARWQLIERRYDGSAEVLFEQGGAPAAA